LFEERCPFGLPRIRRRGDPQQCDLRERRLELLLQRRLDTCEFAALQPDARIQFVIDAGGERQRRNRNQNPSRDDQPSPACGKRGLIYQINPASPGPMSWLLA
jgi:hypothetical protein